MLKFCLIMCLMENEQMHFITSHERTNTEYRITLAGKPPEKKSKDQKQARKQIHDLIPYMLCQLDINTKT